MCTGARIRTRARARAPGATLFVDFCKALAETLPHSLLQGRAETVDKRDDGTYDVILAGNAAPIHTHRVVFALGAAGPPRLLPALSAVCGESVGKPSPRVIHTYSWSKLLAMPFTGETVVVLISRTAGGAQGGPSQPTPSPVAYL